MFCFYCGIGPLKHNALNEDYLATVDHYIPKARGGAEFDPTNLRVACVRCNSNKKDKMPKEDDFKAELEQAERIQKRVQEIMKWDEKKAHWWMITANPNFGNVPPMTLILHGRGHKVEKFIETAADENFPPS